jgi:hypothetical protein
MQTINSLKKRLNQDKLVVQREEGYVEEEVFILYTPASKEELAKLPDYTPNELITFLKQHNGADLFVHPKNGGGTHLFTVDEILEHKNLWECPEYFLPIGTGLDGLWIVCQCDKAKGETSMWIGEFLNFEDDFEKLSLDYSTWLEYYIIAQGASFWEWLR